MTALADASLVASTPDVLEAAVAGATTATTWPALTSARVALLGTGSVGTAFVQRLQQFADDRSPLRPTLVHVANSRVSVSDPAGLDPATVGDSVRTSPRRSQLSDVDAVLHGLRGAPRVVVDATASADVALRHPYWLEAGVHVVTACKIATGGPLSQAWRVAGAAQRGGTSYGDSATVGAGLPVLRTIRELRRGGDAILSVCGVLSGSLAWLLDRYDGRRPIGALVDEARALGLTEPDPRIDLSGEDVRRKLLIITRAAGVSLEPADVQVAPLPDDDRELRVRLDEARAAGRRLRYVARWDESGARVGLESLPVDDALAAGRGRDNRVAIYSSRYRESPLVLQGPGAGAGVTAAALLDDVLRVVRA